MSRGFVDLGRFRTLSAAFALFTTAAPAFADAPDESARQQARELMAAGREQHQRSDLRAALDSFSRADEIMRVPSTSIERARTMRALGMMVEAAEVVTGIESIPESPDEPEAFSKARHLAQELKLELDARTPRVYFYVSGASSTDLALDGKSLDSAAIAQGVRVNPGGHVATATQQGARRTHEFQVAEGQTIEVSLDFSEPLKIPSQGRDLHRRRNAKTSGRTIALYGLTGLSAVGLVGGTTLALVANHNRSTLQKSCAPTCSEESVAQLRGLYVAGTVSLAAGAASAVGALTLYFTQPKDSVRSKDRAGSFTLLPSVGAEPGVSVLGTF